MHAIVFVLAVSGSIWAEVPSAEYTTIDDVANLQGEWELVALRLDGKDYPPEKLKAYHWVFRSHEVIVYEKDRKYDQFSFRLDPTKDLPEFDFLEPGQPNPPRGIYRLEGDRLTIAYTRAIARPRRFTAEEGDGVFLKILRRVRR